MPRAYGTTNAARFSSAPAVGPAGDTYYNTTTNTVYISNGTVWVSLQDSFTSSAKGLAPASGGGTVNYLRADGTWATPTATPLTGNFLRAFTAGGTVQTYEVVLPWTTSVNAAAGVITYSSGTGKYTIGRAGYYRLDVNLTLMAGGWVTLSPYHNTTKYDVVCAGGAYTEGTINQIFSCQVGDTIHMSASAQTATAIDSRSWLNISTLSGAQGPQGVKGDPGAQGAGAGGNQTLPAGMISPFAGSVAPATWFMCDGQEVSRATYSDLFSALGTVYGAGNGSTTFNVPDLRGRSVFGMDNMGGTDAGRLSTANTAGTNGGAETHTLNTTEMPAHAHTYTDGGHWHGIRSVAGAYPQENPFGLGTLAVTDTWNYNTGFNSALNITIQNNGSDGAHNNMPPYIVMNYIIKS